jgi:hypothetical protein
LRKEILFLTCLVALGLSIVASGQAQTRPLVGICFMEELESGEVECSGSCGGVAVDPWTCNKGESCDLNCVTRTGGCHKTELDM